MFEGLKKKLGLGKKKKTDSPESVPETEELHLKDSSTTSIENTDTIRENPENPELSAPKKSDSLESIPETENTVLEPQETATENIDTTTDTSKKFGFFGKKKKESSDSIPETATENADTTKDTSQEESKPETSPERNIPSEIPKPDEKEDEEEEIIEKTGVLSKLKSLFIEHEVNISEKAIDEALYDLQIVLLESDVAFPVAEAITNHMKEELLGSKKKVFTSAEKIITDALKHAIEKVLGNGFDLLAYIQTHDKPVKILFTGVNGTGKTTSVAKIAAYLQSQGCSVVVGAGDTFRAGAIDQIRVHCERLGVKLIAHQEGADPSAVLYDTVEYAKAHKIDVVLADSAGRFHNRTNLMNQLEKIKRVMKPDLVFYVDEAVAGNDAVIRAEEFEKTVSTDGVILTKVDMDPKGGTAISIAYTIGKPLVFLGVGQEYTDMKPFTPSLIVDEIFGED